MIQIKKYTGECKKIWDDFVNTSKIPMFMFNRDFIEYHSDRFVDFSLMFFEDGNLVALLPASIHENEVRSHGGLTYGGFITNESMKQKRMNKCFEELIKFLKQNKIERMIYKAIPYIYHNNSAQEDIYSLYLNNANLLKVEPSTTIHLNNRFKVSKSRKGMISRAKKNKIHIIESEEFNSFIELVNSVLKKYHQIQAVHTNKELVYLKSKFPQNIKLFLAMKEEEIVAGTLIFEYEDCVHTQYMSANEIAREVGALDLLIYDLIEKYSKNKLYFDFGISTEKDGQLLNEGLIFQKEGFGGRTTAYSTYELVLK